MRARVSGRVYGFEPYLGTMVPFWGEDPFFLLFSWIFLKVCGLALELAT